MGRMQGVGMKRRGRVRGRRAEVVWVGGIVGGWGVGWGCLRQSVRVGGGVVVWCWIFLDVGERIDGFWCVLGIDAGWL